MPALAAAAAPGARPAEGAPATTESVVWLPGRPAPDTQERIETAPPAAAAEPAPVTDAAPAPAPAEPRAGDLLAQAGAASRPEPTGAAAAATPDAPVPTYRTRPPAAATLSYRLSRGPIFGTGVIDWRPAGGTYSLQLEGSVAVIGTLITQVSRGRIEATGLAPERHTDRRLRRSEQAANFDRAAGRIGFSGQAPEQPWTPGVQDRVSVMIQLPAIVNAWSRVPPVGEHVLIRVVGARGDSNVWSLRYEGRQAIELPDGRVDALRFLREPDGPNDTRAEFWLDPQRQHLPVRMLLTDGKGDALELLRTP
jgi:hypothetical protein